MYGKQPEALEQAHQLNVSMKITSDASIFFKVLHMVYGCSQIGDPTASFPSSLWVQNAKTTLLILVIFSPTTEQLELKPDLAVDHCHKQQISGVCSSRNTLTPLWPNPSCSLPFSTYSGPKLGLKKHTIWGNLHSSALLNWNSAPEDWEGLFATSQRLLYDHKLCTDTAHVLYAPSRQLCSGGYCTDERPHWQTETVAPQVSTASLARGDSPTLQSWFSWLCSCLTQGSVLHLHSPLVWFFFLNTYELILKSRTANALFCRGFSWCFIVLSVFVCFSLLLFCLFIKHWNTTFSLYNIKKSRISTQITWNYRAVSFRRISSFSFQWHMKKI